MWDQVVFSFQTLFASSSNQTWLELALKFFPFVVLLEAPFYILVTAGMVRYGLRAIRPDQQRERYPRVSCVITCYSEGEDVRKTIESLAQQLYPGHIEIIAVIDGAIQNRPTLEAARNARALLHNTPRRQLLVLPKWQRGGPRIVAERGAIHCHRRNRDGPGRRHLFRQRHGAQCHAPFRRSWRRRSCRKSACAQCQAFPCDSNAGTGISAFHRGRENGLVRIQPCQQHFGRVWRVSHSVHPQPGGGGTRAPRKTWT